MEYIRQSSKGLISRSFVNPYLGDINGGSYLPLITAPMTSVVDEKTYNIFLNKQIHVCLPRKNNFSISSNYFSSCSLETFEEFIVNGMYDEVIKKSELPLKICIDTANGNNPRLHDLIKKSKELYQDKLIIMSGNVSSCEAFIELGKAGCDYIRVGIGGGAGCNTSKNTFVGQTNLADLIYECYQIKNQNWTKEYGFLNLKNVKIVADGISSYIDLTVKENMAYDNGYGAIINLLYSGADLIMIGKLFAQSLESPGNKFYKNNSSKELFSMDKDNVKAEDLFVEYYGMSTKRAQLEYSNSDLTKHSEGKTVFLPVRWTLNEWLNGSEIDSDFLPGFVNCLKSAMSYTGSENLKNFKK